MIDFHSHILPGIDDGSKDMKMSLRMLKLLEEQRVDTVCLTPHFYIREDSIETFLDRRNKAYQELISNYKGSLRFLLGAEVRYYVGISKRENLDKLCLSGTNIILLELPFMTIHDLHLNEIISMSRDYTIVLAHIERYKGLISKKQLDKVLESGILLQVNASYFDSFFTRMKGKKLLKEGKISLIGSDAHNMGTRKPNFDIIRSNLKDEVDIIELNERNLGI